MDKFRITHALFFCILVTTLSCTAAKDKEDFSIIVLPDSQNVVRTDRPSDFIDHFYNQTEWIKENVEKLNIKYVLHLGDVTEHNNIEEWDRAKTAMDTLNGVVPYAICPGNHDYGPKGRVDLDRQTLFNNSSKDANPYFGPDTYYATQPSVGGFYPAELDRTENSWHVFKAQGTKYLILTLEWGPRNPVVEWAETVVSNHPNHRVIMITHAYMFNDDTRYDWSTKQQPYNPHQLYYGTAVHPLGTNDGEELWQKLVGKHNNFIMVINGHVIGEPDGTNAGVLSSSGDHGNMVHQMLANYQSYNEGGDGYLRILTFKGDSDEVEVRTYSPSLEKYDTAPDQQFTLKLSTAL